MGSPGSADNGRRARGRLVRLAVAVMLAGGLVSCASLAASPPAAQPALATPPPPPRELSPPPEPEADAPTPVIVPAQPAPSRAPRGSQKPVPEKPDVPPAVSPPPAETPPRVAGEAPASGGLQTTTHVDEAERRIRGTMAEASRELALVDERRLGSGAKQQYESARRFIAQADEALKSRNLVFAEQLAVKALGLASGLRGR